MRYLLLPLLLVAIACQNDLPTDMDPVDPPPAHLVNCTQMINVGTVAAVDVSPETQVFPWSGSGSLTAAVIRDNSSIPGIQFHCQDYNATVTFQVLGFLAPAWQLFNIQKQSAGIRLTSPTPGQSGAWNLVRGYIGTKADTVRVEID